MKKRYKFAFTILGLGLLSSGIFASVAWFSPSTNSFSARISGNLVEEYFHCGSGTENDPFVITRPVHYYHLTEFFQRETVLPTSNGEKHFGTDYLYFQVGYPLIENDSSLYVYEYDNTGTYTGTANNPRYSKTLNLAYFSNDNALMPIGTNEIPFFGSFDGGASSTAANGITIANLNIKTSDTVLVGNTPTNRSTSDAGVFGYVADQKDASHKTVIANAYFNNLTIDLTGASNSTSDAGHVDAHENDEIYVGYVVGHMHTYNRYDSTGPTNSSPLHDVYVNNAKIQGGSGAVSKFGYVGFADTINGEDGDDIDYADIIDDLASAAGGGGQGDDWGGSINIRSLNNRIWNLLNAPNDVKTDDPSINHPTVSTSTPTTDIALQSAGKTYASFYDYHRYYYDNYNYVSVENAISETRYNNRNPETITNIYRLAGNGTYSNYSKDDANRKKIVVPGTALPLSVGEKADGYPVSNKNTGYIVSGMAGGTGSYTGQTTIRVASSPIGAHIGNSLSSSGTSSTGYTQSQLEVITTTNPGNYNSSNFSRIKDNYNASNTSVSSVLSSKYSSRGVDSSTLVKYNDSREQLHDILNGQSFAHGLHFTGSSISSSTTFELPTAVVNGNSYTNYAMPKNSIDFNLKEAGYINFFAGSYQHSTSTTCDSFFSLHVIRRNVSGAISSINEISKIYNNSNVDTNKEFPYVYEFTSGTDYAGMKDGSEVAFTKGANVVFDLQYLWDAPQVNYAVYYFEVPVNSGEFAMGSHAGKDKGTYLLYLDLAASGSEEEHTQNTDNMIADDPIFTQMEYTSNGFVTNSCFNISYVVPAGATKESFYIKVSRNGDIFAVEVVNTTANSFVINVLLVDDDDDPDNDYPYTYTLKYNAGSVSAEYDHSGTFSGAASGTSFVLQT